MKHIGKSVLNIGKILYDNLTYVNFAKYLLIKSLLVGCLIVSLLALSGCSEPLIPEEQAELQDHLRDKRGLDIAVKHRGRL